MGTSSAIVVGAGSWGIWTAIHLLNKGVDTTLVEMDSPGHRNAGSGGYSRIIRNTYGSQQIYTDLTNNSFSQWQLLERQTGSTVYHETGVLWFATTENNSYLKDSITSLDRVGESLHKIAESEAKRSYGQVNFEDVYETYLEPRAGVLEAAKACKLGLMYFQELGGKYVNGRVNAVDKDMGSVTVNDVVLQADTLVFATGSWTRKLFPDLLEALTYVSRQEVFFYALQGNDQKRFSDFPVWFDFDNDGMFYYGFPPIGEHGFKIAYDDRSIATDPDNLGNEYTIDIEKRCYDFLHHRFEFEGPLKRVDHRICHYDNSLDGDFIIDRLPSNSDIYFMTGSSGHGYKLGPGLGALMADVVMGSKEIPEEFTLERFENVDSQKTQFDF